MRTTNKKARVVSETADRDKKITQRIDRKKNLVVEQNIRVAFRSKKPDLETKKKKSDPVPEGVKDMRSYLGMDLQEWDTQPQA